VFARALISSPNFILAREPTELNLSTGRRLWELFRQLGIMKRGHHNSSYHSEKTLSYGSRIINLLDGRKNIVFEKFYYFKRSPTLWK